MIQKFQGKLATWFGAYYDPEKNVDVWPHYAVENAVRRTLIFSFVLINLVTWAFGTGESLNTGILPTGLSTTRALIIVVIFLKLYPSTVKLFAKSLEKVPHTEYREDMKNRTDEDNPVLSYLAKNYEENDKEDDLN